MSRGSWVMAGMAAGVLLLSVVLQNMESQTGVFRYQQHREQPSEEELGPCTVCDGGGLCTHLPIIQIETEGQTIPGRPYENAKGETAGYYMGDHGEKEILVRFSTVSEEGVWHHTGDQSTDQGTAMFRYRGNSSRWFIKGSFMLGLVDEKNPEAEVEMGLLGMKKGKEWALHGPFLDKTLLRNYMWMNLSAEVMGTWVPDTRFCELILDGTYQGVYLLMETIDVDENRLDLNPYTEGDPVFSYLTRIERWTNPEKILNNFSLYSYRMEPGRNLELLYPGRMYQTPQVKEYVQADYSEAERLLYSPRMTEKDRAWESVIDVDSMVNYYVLMEFLAVNDVFGASTYFYRDARGKLAIGPVWDFNNALDNFLRPMEANAFLLSQRGWYAMLMQDKEFVEKVIFRYKYLRRGVLSEERLMAYIEEVDAWLGSAVQRNFEVWGYSFDPVRLDTRNRRRPNLGSGETLRSVNPSSHEEAVEWMVDYMVKRGRWLDEHIESLRQYCHPSRFSGGIQW